MAGSSPWRATLSSSHAGTPEHLRVAEPPATYDDADWQQQPGPTVFAPFGGVEHTASPHLGPAGWGINFRIGNLDVMVHQLERTGIEVEVDPEEYPNGLLAQLRDPEGNAVQLWEPSAGPPPVTMAGTHWAKESSDREHLR